MSTKTSGKRKPAKKTKKKEAQAVPTDGLPFLQSMEGLFAGFGGRGERKASAVDQAQEIMYDAWEATTRRQRVALAKRAIEISADCAASRTVIPLVALISCPLMVRVIWSNLSSLTL